MPQDLEIKIDETIVNLRNLHQELLSLRQHISEVCVLQTFYSVFQYSVLRYMKN